MLMKYVHFFIILLRWIQTEWLRVFIKNQNSSNSTNMLNIPITKPKITLCKFSPFKKFL